jgi:phosphoribosylformylglycinamidine synthase
MKNFKAKINITLREGILDVQGKTVEHALHTLEYNDLTHIRIGKYVEINVLANDKTQAESRVNDACKQLIANPIIEDFRIIIEEMD